VADLLRDRLQSSLGGAYTLERELGGGGMSRVFVAREEALGRDVVVKVLSPELAEGLSAERFAREIRLAARLQHPNVVPVLTTGVAADGLPYYTMPYVRGESLRARLLRGRVPRDEALTILRDVLRALGAAHREGVVHRDVKPENVLLHDGAAVVTDFGIAKALAESRTLAQEGERHDDGSGTITRLGTTLGTPAYMAPEQATGDRVDARADLYAWGVVAHELLAGQHPFAGKENAQQWIAAHLTEPPPALPADVRAPLAALVRQCLEKEPARRPADAATALAALDRTAPDRAAPDHAGVTGPAVPAPLPAGEADAPAHPRRRWRRLLAAVPAGLLAVALGGWYGLLSASDRAMLTVLATRDPLELRVNRVVVAPFRNETGDPSLAALGPLVADVLTSGLASLPGVEVVDARTAAASADVVRRIPRLLRRRDATLALADEVGAGVLLDGSYYRDGDSVRVRARVLDASSGAVRRALPEVAVAPTAPADGLRRLAERTVALMRAASDPGNNMPLREFDIPNSLPATEAVLAGYAAYLRSDTAAFALMDRAVALDTGFVGAYGARAFVLATLGAARRPARADAALEDARARRDRMLPPAQALTDMAGAAREAAVPRLLDAAEHYLAAVPLSPEGRLAVGRYALDARRPRRVLDVLQGMDTDRG
jgi:serine/threonine-protein kinase